ncbi:hypothetical protein [Collimonas sp.]|jgi:hypothetical protein|uniref:hypothetical protein n=1 Tax=Collimonas sp. TaxID=1963772 RepID=UPI002BEBFE5E|nr:hypothetical protein [Collimonas sp.]HWW99981.1 hypothetical protein [Collimonas sp.]
MGSKSKRLKAFLTKHPICCYCSGQTPATTEDHWPSRSIFDQRKWPEGYVFPACTRCNNATASDEALFALLCRLNQEHLDAAKSEQTKKLLMAVNERLPAIYRSFFQSPNQIRRWLTETGRQLEPGQSTRDVPVISLKHPEIHERVKRCATKLFLSLHYLHTGRILSNDGGVIFLWFTNATKTDEIPIQIVTPFLTGTPKLKWQNFPLNDQFTYSYGADEIEGLVSIFFATFNSSVGMIGILFNDLSNLKVDIPQEQILRPFTTVLNPLDLSII